MNRQIAISVIALGAVNVAPATTTEAAVAKPSVFARLLHALAVHHQRCALATLDARQLDDIGVSQRQARQEAARGLLDTPSQRA